MNNVIPFRTPETRMPEEAFLLPGLRERTASGELPVTTKIERQRLSGSVEGADEAEVQRRTLAANPMRMLSRLRCDTCGHSWQQPAATGLCPRCRSQAPTLVEQLPCMALRV